MGLATRKFYPKSNFEIRQITRHFEDVATNGVFADFILASLNNVPQSACAVMYERLWKRKPSFPMETFSADDNYLCASKKLYQRS